MMEMHLKNPIDLSESAVDKTRYRAVLKLWKFKIVLYNFGYIYNYMLKEI